MGLIFCYFSKDHNKIQTYGANMQSEFTTELFSGLILITGSRMKMPTFIIIYKKASYKIINFKNFEFGRRD